MPPRDVGRGPTDAYAGLCEPPVLSGVTVADAAGPRFPLHSTPPLPPPTVLCRCVTVLGLAALFALPGASFPPPLSPRLPLRPPTAEFPTCAAPVAHTAPVDQRGVARSPCFCMCAPRTPWEDESSAVHDRTRRKARVRQPWYVTVSNSCLSLECRSLVFFVAFVLPLPCCCSS